MVSQAHDLQFFTLFIFIDSEHDTFFINIMNFLQSKVHLDWITLGYHMQLSVPDLHNIELGYGEDNKRCIRQLLFKWRESHPDASWEPIAEALKTSGHMTLSTVVTKLCKNPGSTVWEHTHGLDINDLAASFPNSMT